MFKDLLKEKDDIYVSFIVRNTISNNDINKERAKEIMQKDFSQMSELFQKFEEKQSQYIFVRKDMELRMKMKDIWDDQCARTKMIAESVITEIEILAKKNNYNIKEIISL